jgi:hypothetical protein
MARRKARIGSDPDDEVIAQIKAFIQDHPPPDFPPNKMLTVPERRTLGFTPRILYQVVSETEVAKAESSIGFRIPNLLRRLYLEVSNGIAGFRYQIVGLRGGCASGDGTLVDVYHGLKRAIEYDGGKWRPGLLGFCHWGCTIWSCVDCTNPLGPVLTCQEGEVSEEGYTIHDFYRMWVKGKVCFLEDAEVVAKTIKNPFTGKKTTVYGRRTRKPPK